MVRAIAGAGNEAVKGFNYVVEKSWLAVRLGTSRGRSSASPCSTSRNSEGWTFLGSSTQSFSND